MSRGYILATIAVVAFVTITIRFLPFVVFKNGAPKLVKDIGEMLPFSIMMMLVVYCLKGMTLFSGNHGIPEIIAVIYVCAIHKFKHNVLLSIITGTVLYMLLIHFF